MSAVSTKSQPDPIPLPRDRDILIAVLRLVGALAERLTGQVPVVKIENERGDFVWCRVSARHVRWEGAEATVSPCPQREPNREQRP